jgi:hypothetical protein
VAQDMAAKLLSPRSGEWRGGVNVALGGRLTYFVKHAVPLMSRHTCN